ncbi:MAG: hypothetical protein VCA73_12180, partial [Roseibacillus sp.]
ETHNGDWYVHGEGISADIVVAPGPVLNHFDGIVDNLPTSGSYVGLPGPADVGRGPDEDFEIGRNMDASIALDPSVTATFQSGTTTWFSYLAVKAWDRNEETPNLVIGTDPAPAGSRGDNYGGIGNGFSGFGTGGGPTRNNRTRIYPMFYDAGQYSNVNGAIPGNAYNQAAFEVSAADSFVWQENDGDENFGAPNIVIGKIQWDAEAGGEDIITVVRFLEDETLEEAGFDALVAAQPNLSSANWADANKPDLDQGQLDTITFMGLKFFVDEIRIGTTFDDVVRGGVSPSIPAQLIIASDGVDLRFKWESQSGMLYNLRSETDPSNGEPKNWPIFERRGDIEATPPENTLTIPLPADASRYFVVQEFPKPPAVVFEDNFDGRNDLAPWTNSSPDGNPWELGVPTAVLGPPSAFSAPNAVGTVLAGNYIASDALDTFVVSTLRSPAMDLSGIVSGTISYQRYVDMEDPQFDFATVNLRDAADDSLIEVLEPDIGNGNLTWEGVSHDIPAAAIGKSVIFEIVFSSDNFDSLQTGLVIDDFKVEGVEP